MCTLGFVFVITVQHSLIPADKEDIDKLCMWIFLILWFIVHIGFAIYCPILAYKERKKLTMNTKQLKKLENEDDKIIAHKFEFDKQHIKSIEANQWVSFLCKTE